MQFIAGNFMLKQFYVEYPSIRDCQNVESIHFVTAKRAQLLALNVNSSDHGCDARVTIAFPWERRPCVAGVLTFLVRNALGRVSECEPRLV